MRTHCRVWSNIGYIEGDDIEIRFYGWIKDGESDLNNALLSGINHRERKGSLKALVEKESGCRLRF